MRKLVLSVTRPFPRDWDWIPEPLRAQTPLSVVVFLLLLGGLIFLPRSELTYSEDGQAPGLSFDWQSGLAWLGSMVLFWLLAVLVQSVGERRPWLRQVGRWGFQATQFATIVLLLLFTSYFTGFGRSDYSKGTWDEAHVYLLIALAFSLVAWLASAMSRQLYQRFSHKREVVGEMMRLAAELLRTDNGRHYAGYVGHRSPCGIWFSQASRRHRLRLLVACLSDWASQFAFVVIRYGVSVLTVVSASTLLLTVGMQALALTRWRWVERFSNWALAADQLWTFFAGSLIVGLLACWFATLFRERRAARWLEAVRSILQANGAFLVSAVLIAVILATLWDVKYVSTVVLGAPQLVFKWVAFFFLLIWNFQYLVQSALDLRLFDILERFSKPRGDRRQGSQLRSRQLATPTTGAESAETEAIGETRPREEATIEPTDSRAMASDGSDEIDDTDEPDDHVDRMELPVGSELAGLGRYGISGFQLPVSAEVAKPSTQLELFAVRDDASPLDRPVPSDPPVVISRDDLFSAMIGRPQTHHAGEMMRRDTHRYLSAVNLLLAAGLFSIFGVMRSPKLQGDKGLLDGVRPIVALTIGETDQSPVSRLVSGFPDGPSQPAGNLAATKVAEQLRSICFADTESESPVIFLAASGGGTRAALYTASVLAKLRRISKLKDVRMMSGASGGCVALGYFLCHYEDLMDAHPDQADYEFDQFDHQGKKIPGLNPWTRFYNAMQADYIVDAVRGLTQIRTVRGQPLGVHLAEAFDRQWQPDRRSKFSQLVAGQIPKGTTTARPGFVVVTTIAGISPSYTRDPLFTFPVDGNPLTAADAYHAGGRLLFTNFDVVSDWFPHPDRLSSGHEDSLAWKRQLKAWRFDVISHARVPLTKLVALSANFPPVFQNAGIAVRGSDGAGGDQRTYWITDGGVVDNRGIVPMMYAVEGMLRDLPAGQRLARPILFLVADAGRSGNKYAQDRGVSAASSAGTELANQLIREKLTDIRRLVDGEPMNGDWSAEHRVQYHYLPMPHALRFNDAGSGFGTHWMPDWSLTVQSIREQPEHCSHSVSIGRRQLIELMRWLGGDTTHSEPGENNDPQVRKAIDILEKNDDVWAGTYGRIVGEIAHHQAWANLEQALQLTGDESAKAAQ